MTFDDDFIRLMDYDAKLKPPPGKPIEAIVPTPRIINLRCKDLGISWPPPDILTLEDGTGRQWTRIQMSSITDEQRQKMTHVARGAVYKRVVS